MPPWNDTFVEHPVLAAVIVLLLLLVLGMIVDPGLEGLASFTPL